MNKKFLLNILFLLAINLLIKPFYIFGIDRTVQNTVEPAIYGLYFALFNFTFLFQIINDFGIQSFNNRTIAQDNQLLHKYFPHLFLLKLGLGLGYLGVVFFMAWLADYPPLVYHWIFVIACNHFLNSFILFLRSNISGLGYYTLDSILSVIDKLLLIGLCSYLLWFAPFRADFNISWFIYAQTFTLCCTALIAFIIVYNKLESLQLSLDIPFLVNLLKQAFPYALAIFLMTIYARVDAVMLERLLPNGQQEAGIYATAYRILDAFNMIGYLFSSLLLPMFATLLKDKKNAAPLLQLSAQLIWAGAIALSVSVCFFAEPIMKLLYPNIDAAYSSAILRYLIIGFIGVCGSYVFSTLLVANNDLKLMNRIIIISVVLNIGLNAYLIPTQQALGAAIATLVTEWFTMAGFIYLCFFALNVKLATSIWLRLVAYIFLSMISVYFIHNANFFTWPIRFFSSLVTNLVLAFGVKLIDINMLFELVRNRTSS